MQAAYRLATLISLTSQYIARHRALESLRHDLLESGEDKGRLEVDLKEAARYQRIVRWEWLELKCSGVSEGKLCAWKGSRLMSEIAGCVS